MFGGSFKTTVVLNEMHLNHNAKNKSVMCFDNFEFVNHIALGDVQ